VWRKPWATPLLSHKTASLLATLSFTLTAGVLILTQSRSAYIGVATGLIVLAISRNRWFWLSVPLLAAIALARSLVAWCREFSQLDTDAGRDGYCCRQV